jgi:hypothetical protein
MDFGSWLDGLWVVLVRTLGRGWMDLGACSDGLWDSGGWALDQGCVDFGTGAYELGDVVGWTWGLILPRMKIWVLRAKERRPYCRLFSGERGREGQ